MRALLWYWTADKPTNVFRLQALPAMPKMKIDYLADCPLHLPTIAVWQQAQFGYLTPTATFEDRAERLRRSLQKEALPMAFIAIRKRNAARIGWYSSDDHNPQAPDAVAFVRVRSRRLQGAGNCFGIEPACNCRGSKAGV